MKLFTGSLAAGLVLLAGGAQAQVPGPYRAASDVRHTVAPSPGIAGAAVRTRAALRHPGRGTDTAPAPACCRRRKSIPCCATTDSRRSASRRLRGFVYTIAVIDRGGEDGRLIIDARNGRIIRFMPAYRMGGQLLRGPERPRWTLRGSSRRRPHAPDPCQAAPRPSQPAPCCEPHGAGAEGQAARRQTRSRAGTGPAGGSACAEAGRGAGSRPGDNRLGSSQARPADCSDPGHADGAGAGVKHP